MTNLNDDVLFRVLVAYVNVDLASTNDPKIKLPEYGLKKQDVLRVIKLLGVNMDGNGKNGSEAKVTTAIIKLKKLGFIKYTKLGKEKLELGYNFRGMHIDYSSLCESIIKSVYDKNSCIWSSLEIELKEELVKELQIQLEYLSKVMVGEVSFNTNKYKYFYNILGEDRHLSRNLFEVEFMNNDKKATFNLKKYSSLESFYNSFLESLLNDKVFYKIRARAFKRIEETFDNVDTQEIKKESFDRSYSLLRGQIKTYFFNLNLSKRYLNEYLASLS